MNLAMVLAIYASISKELGLPLRFPGKPGAYDSLLEMTDAALLAKATVWAATEQRCANQAFNITNGDLFRWNELWPKIAYYSQFMVFNSFFNRLYFSSHNLLCFFRISKNACREGDTHFSSW